MKSLLLLPLLLVASSAFASSPARFACGTLADNNDGFSYSVLRDPDTINYGLPNALTLQLVGSGHGPAVSLSMTLSQEQSSEGAIYTNANTDVEVIYSIAPAMPGHPAFYIDVRKTVNGTEFKAPCKYAPATN